MLIDDVMCRSEVYHPAVWIWFNSYIISIGRNCDRVSLKINESVNQLVLSELRFRGRGTVQSHVITCSSVVPLPIIGHFPKILKSLSLSLSLEEEQCQNDTVMMRTTTTLMLLKQILYLSDVTVSGQSLTG